MERLALALALLPGIAAAVEVPRLDRRVLDRAELLSPGVEARLERGLADYERRTSHQIVVHTTPSLEGLEIEDYSIQLAEAWKVGHAELDNGVILTVAPNERRVRIEVGYGLEGVVPDAVAARIVREVILPAFGRGELEAGILAGVDRIQRVASGEVIPGAERPASPLGESRRPSGGWPVWVWLVVFLVFGFRGLFFLPFLGGVRGRGGFRGGGIGGGGFGGGGGFSGGGGGFGGGGASGSW